jgi:hypothetical protein
MIIQKALHTIGVIQEVSNEGRNPKLGKGYFKAHRLNPYNPLSYIVFLLGLLIGLVLFGVIGIKEQTDGNPFKWS